MEDQIKILRMAVDKAIKSVNFLPKGREVSLAFTNLERCKMWLGKVLEAIGVTTPYPESNNPESKVIEPQADQSEETLFNNPAELDEVEAIKIVRQYLHRLTADMVALYKNHIGGAQMVRLSLENSLSALSESKMWLGGALNQIRKKQLSDHDHKQLQKTEALTKADQGIKPDDRSATGTVTPVAGEVVSMSGTPEGMVERVVTADKTSQE